MNPISRVAAGLLAALLAGGAAAQFNTDAMKKMQKEGLERLEEEKAAETAKPAAADKAAAARRAYRTGNKLCLDARGALSVEPCNGKAASQQWAFDAGRHLVADPDVPLDDGSGLQLSLQRSSKTSDQPRDWKPLTPAT